MNTPGQAQLCESSHLQHEVRWSRSLALLLAREAGSQARVLVDAGEKDLSAGRQRRFLRRRTNSPGTALIAVWKRRPIAPGRPLTAR